MFPLLIRVMHDERALPVEEIREAFSKVATQNRPFIVEAPTGSGKSTRLPLWLAEARGRCLVVEPRRMACQSLATHLAKARRQPVGQDVGLCMRGVSKYSAQTKILFVTPGIALRFLADNDAFTDCVLVDEFHERSADIDLVVSVLRARAVCWGVTSATVDGTSWASRFDANHLVAKGRSFPVVCTHDESMSAPSRSMLAERIVHTLGRALDENPDGDVLVFLPGMREIQEAKAAAQSLCHRAGLSAHIAHSSVSPAELEYLFREDGPRRVIFSTNVAETSVTFPRVRVVIDSGLERRRVHRGGRAVLLQHAISAASAEQRRGRAGRVAPGRCYRLYRSTAALEVSTPPEVERMPLDDLCIQAAACGLSLDAPEAAPWPSLPPAQAFQEARDRLRLQGLLDEQNTLTTKGRECASFPVGIRAASILWKAPAPWVPRLSALLALVEEGRGVLSRHPRPSEYSARANDFVELTSIEQEVLALLHPEGRQYGIDEPRYTNLQRVVRDLRACISAQGETVSPTDPTLRGRLPAELLQFLVERDASFAFARRAHTARGSHASLEQARYSNGTHELFCASETSPFEDEPRPLPPFALVFRQSWRLPRAGAAPQGRGEWLVPVDRELLLAAHAGQSEVDALIFQPGPDGTEVPLVQESRQLAGVSLGGQSRAPAPAELFDLVATRMQQTLVAVYGGARPERQYRAHESIAVDDALRVWEAVAFCGEAPAAPSFRDWITGRLAALGVESHEDLTLLSLADWTPDLSSACGVAPWEHERWLNEFPRFWRYEGGNYSCDLEAAGVILRPTDVKSRKQKQVHADRVPRFRGKAVYLQHASRRVRLR